MYKIWIDPFINHLIILNNLLAETISTSFVFKETNVQYFRK